MPHWDFRCEKCGHVEDLSFSSFAAMEQNAPRSCQVRNSCFKGTCGGRMIREIAAPRFDVNGFSEVNGYASPIDVTKRKHGMKIQIKGNPEILRDGTGR